MHYNLNNSRWCQQQDQLVAELVREHGVKNWSRIADELNLAICNNKKSGKQCRERWHNHINPQIVRKSWTPAEERVLFENHKIYGNKWTAIAEKLSGRTENCIKNHFYSIIRRSLRRMSKMVGMKNSTVKLREIKPAALSEIFRIAEGKESADKASSQSTSPPNQSLSEKQVGEILMNFAKQKPINKKNSQAQIERYSKLLEQIGSINEKYKGYKFEMAKLRKQRRLEKDFDNVASQGESGLDEMEEESGGEGLMGIDGRSQQADGGSQQSEKVDKDLDLRNMTKSGVVVKKQELLCGISAQFEPKKSIKYSQMQDSECEDEPPIKEEESAPQFNIELDQCNNFNLQQGLLSPGFINTPLALTPTHFNALLQQPIKQVPSINNQDCDCVLATLKSQIQSKIYPEMGHKEQLQTFSLSPSSAFRQCN